MEGSQVTTPSRVDYSQLSPRETLEAIRELERQYMPENIVREELEPAWATVLNRLGYDVPAGDEPQAPAGEDTT